LVIADILVVGICSRDVVDRVSSIAFSGLKNDVVVAIAGPSAVVKCVECKGKI